MRKLLSFFVFLLLFSSLNVDVVFSENQKIEIDLNLEETDLAYSFFDLSNGEATLLQSGVGGNILIGTGSKHARMELEERLDMYNVKELTAIIVTNFAEEYVGNLNWVIENYNVKKIYVPKVIMEELAETYTLSDIEVISWEEGNRQELFSSLYAEVIYVETMDLEHKGALSVLFTYGNQKMLYMAIASEKVENLLIEKYSLKSTVLKVAEFGNEQGTTQRFLDEVDPQVAIVFKKKGEAVSEIVLERLQETWIDIYQTYRIGTVSIKCHNDDYEIFTVRQDEEDFSFGLANSIDYK